MVTHRRQSTRGKSRGNTPGKYTGKLARRRKLSQALEQLYNWRAAGLSDSDPALWIPKQDLGDLQDKNYVNEGLELLRQHYRITVTEPTAFYAALAFCLTRAHVPYFMPPVRRRGRPKRLQVIFPLIRGLIEARQGGRIGASNERIFALFAELLGVSPETVEREYRRWLTSRGGNSPT